MPPKRTSPGRRVRWVASMLLLAMTVGTGSSLAADPETELAQARARLESHSSYFTSVQARAQQAAQELAVAQSRFDEVEAEVRRTAAALLGNRDRAVDHARSLYMGGSMDALEAVLESQSLSDVETQLTYLQYSGEHQTILFEELRVQRSRLDRELDELERLRDQARRTATALADLQAEAASRLAELEADAALLSAELQAELDAVRQAAASVQQTTPHPSSSAPVTGPPYNADWDAIAQCESGGNWHLDSQYDGGLQFHPDTWLAYGGGQYAQYAWQASREQQISVAEKVLAGQGPGAWPHCFQSL